MLYTTKDQMSVPYHRIRCNICSNEINENGVRHVPSLAPPKREISPTGADGSESAQSTENDGSEDGEASEGGCYDVRKKGW